MPWLHFQICIPYNLQIEFNRAALLPLTELVRDTASAEVFLLGCAALANLSFLGRESCTAAMLRAGTCRVLLSAATQDLSVFTKDQVGKLL